VSLARKLGKGEGEKAFEAKFKDVNAPNPPMQEGIVPLNALNCKSNPYKVVDLRSQIGVKEPSKKFFPKAKPVIDVNLPRHEGNEPVNEL